MRGSEHPLPSMVDTDPLELLLSFIHDEDEDGVLRKQLIWFGLPLGKQSSLVGFKPNISSFLINKWLNFLLFLLGATESFVFRYFLLRVPGGSSAALLAMRRILYIMCRHGIQV